jgi:iron complex transport system ATP-binding protein
MIVADDLTIGYRGHVVAQGVSLALRAGELLAIVGPNGAGKSTLLRTLAGLLRPLAGVVRFDEQRLDAFSPEQRARSIAYVTAEDAGVSDMRVAEVVTQGRMPHRPWWRWGFVDADERAIARAVEKAGLDDLLERPMGSLSSGEAQRVWIGMALAQDASVLLLDEPTSHLDVRRAHETLELLVSLARSGHAVGVVVHDLNLAARYANRIAIVAAGRLLAIGERDEVLQPGLLSNAYDADVRVLHDDDGTPVTVARSRPAER